LGLESDLGTEAANSKGGGKFNAGDLYAKRISFWARFARPLTEKNEADFSAPLQGGAKNYSSFSWVPFISCVAFLKIVESRQGMSGR
jgi:hypothetical protein